MNSPMKPPHRLILSVPRVLDAFCKTWDWPASESSASSGSPNFFALYQFCTSHRTSRTPRFRESNSSILVGYYRFTTKDKPCHYLSLFRTQWTNPIISPSISSLLGEMFWQSTSNDCSSQVIYTLTDYSSMVQVVWLEHTVSASQMRRDTNFAIPGYEGKNPQS